MTLFLVTWYVFLFVWYFGGPPSVRSTAYGTTERVETSCCPELQQSIPRYAITEVTTNLTDCGPELVFRLFSGPTVCVPAVGWARELACNIRSERDAMSSVSRIIKEVARVLTENYRGNDAFEYPGVDIDLDDFMYAVIDIRRRTKIYSRSYEYRVRDGISWIKCRCDLKLYVDSKFFPEGIGAGKPKASISYTLDVTFSAADGDLFTRCTHNHLYVQDVLSWLPPPGRHSVLSGRR